MFVYFRLLIPYARRLPLIVSLTFGSNKARKGDASHSKTKLRNFGFSEEKKISLFDYGFLMIIGSLWLIGFLSIAGSLTDGGFLPLFGSLIDCGFSRMAWLATFHWIS
jgi:hypothetical protein